MFCPPPWAWTLDMLMMLPCTPSLRIIADTPIKTAVTTASRLTSACAGSSKPATFLVFLAVLLRFTLTQQHWCSRVDVHNTIPYLRCCGLQAASIRDACIGRSNGCQSTETKALPAQLTRPWQVVNVESNTSKTCLQSSAKARSAFTKTALQTPLLRVAAAVLPTLSFLSTSTSPFAP
jgi:hypothetical protein